MLSPWDGDDLEKPGPGRGEKDGKRGSHTPTPRSTAHLHWFPTHNRVLGGGTCLTRPGRSGMMSGLRLAPGRVSRELVLLTGWEWEERGTWPLCQIHPPTCEVA